MADNEDGSMLSYAKGEFGEDEHYPDRTNFAYIDKWSSMGPDKEAYVFRPSADEKQSVTFSQLKNATEALAIWLKREFSLKKGDNVGILSLNRIEYVLCEFALSRLGAVSVRFYVAMADSKSTELVPNLRRTNCRLLLCQCAYLGSVSAILSLKSHDVARRLALAELPKLEQVVSMNGEACPGTFSLPNWREIQIPEKEKRDLYEIQSTISLDDDCSICSTSGSTGEPKLVVLSQAGVMGHRPSLIRKAGMTPDDRFFADRPLAHRGGTTMIAITIGATMVIAEPWKTATGESAASDYLLTIMKEENVTCGVSFPYLLYDTVKSESAAEFKKIRTRFFMFGGQLINEEIIGTLKNQLQTPLIHSYGTTEMGEICCTSLTDSVRIVSRFAGQVVPGCEVKIVDPETGQILRRDEIGVIAVRRPHKWYYLNDVEKMAKSHDSEGFYYPGDMGRMTESGYVEIVGRDDDMMSVGTLRLYPASIELMLCKHPSVDKAIAF